MNSNFLFSRAYIYINICCYGIYTLYWDLYPYSFHSALCSTFSIFRTSFSLGLLAESWDTIYVYIYILYWKHIHSYSTLEEQNNISYFLWWKFLLCRKFKILGFFSFLFWLGLDWELYIIGMHPTTSRFPLPPCEVDSVSTIDSHYISVLY